PDRAALAGRPGRASARTRDGLRGNDRPAPEERGGRTGVRPGEREVRVHRGERRPGNGRERPRTDRGRLAPPRASPPETPDTRRPHERNLPGGHLSPERPSC